MRTASALLLSALLAAPSAAQRRLVPQQYGTIQAAIAAAAPGDTVLVADGTYVENLDFLGKDVVVASYFALDRDLAHVAATVVDGSGSPNPDTASVVTFRRGETRGAVLEGLTLTGGTGTRWDDEAGFGIYQEGGGILVAFASPTIRYNRIVGNEAVRRCADCVSAGGGAIRAGNGAPLIEHNVIADNRAMYGGGVVLNYTSAVLWNNVVVRNRVYQAAPGAPTFGGGGLWINGIGPDGTTPVTVEHNTVADNAVESGAGGTAYSGRGGGVLFLQGALAFRENVVWGNTQVTGGAFARISGTLTAAYNDTQEAALDGPGNLSADPLLLSPAYTLGDGSPAIDAGDPDPARGDPEDPNSPGLALPPARGTVRSDVGAYGGPGAAPLAAVPTVAAEPGPPSAGLSISVRPNPATGGVTLVVSAPRGPVAAEVFDALGRHVRSLRVPAHHGGALSLLWDGRDGGGLPVSAGRYVINVTSEAGLGTATVTLVR